MLTRNNWMEKATDLFMAWCLVWGLIGMVFSVLSPEVSLVPRYGESLEAMRGRKVEPSVVHAPPVPHIPPPVQNQMDAFVATVTGEQVTFQQAHGRPFQLLSRDTDGVMECPADDQEIGLPCPAITAPGPPLLVTLRVDEYAGPSGAGYVIIFEYKLGANLYRKEINYGPETWRDRDWYLTG